jgi:DNA topoisomerase I
MERAGTPGKQLNSILSDPFQMAQAAKLIYVRDDQPGITRLKKGKGFVYLLGDKKLKNSEDLLRIKRLVIPPAWKKVWICSLPNGHLQATGRDLRQRKQYKYHVLWSELSSQTKFHRMADFGKRLPKIRERIQRDLSLKGLPGKKVIATIVSLMEQTSIRIGNDAYEKLYGSHGITTLKDKHVRFKGSEMKFAFKGKKGIAQNIVVADQKLAKIVRRCRDIPGQHLFQYYDRDGEAKHIDSGMVNTYIQTICGKGFSAKDFRTWLGTVKALEELSKTEYRNTSDMKRKIVGALDRVSAFLGNTRSVCKKYYVHPLVFSLFEKKELQRLIPKFSTKHFIKGLSREENILLKLLEKESFLIPS